MLAAYSKQLKKLKSERINFIDPLLRLTEFLGLTPKRSDNTKRRDYYVVFIGIFMLVFSLISLGYRYTRARKKGFGSYAYVDLLKQITLTYLILFCHFGLGFYKRNKYLKLFQELNSVDFELKKLFDSDSTETKIERENQFKKIGVKTSEFRKEERKINIVEKFEEKMIKAKKNGQEANEAKTFKINLIEKVLGGQKIYESNTIKPKTTATKKSRFKYNQKYFLIEFYMTCALINIQNILDAVAWIKELGFATYSIFICEYVQTTFMFFMVILMYNLSLAIGYRFEIFTKKLMVIKKDKIFDYFHLKHLQKLYVKLDNAVNIFNEVFGWLLLILIVDIIFSLLITFTLLIFSTYKFITLYVQLLWSASFLACVIFMASSCEKTKFECEKVKVLCHKILSGVERRPENFRFLEELKLLCGYANKHTTVFTAAGFFNVDYSILIPFFEAVIINVVVILQLG